MRAGRWPSGRVVARPLSWLLLVAWLGLWIGGAALPVRADHGAGRVLVLPLEYVKLRFDIGQS